MSFERHVFVSDVHIGAFSDEENKRIEMELFSLIHHCREQKYALYILGDLFDYWMEFPKQKYIPSVGREVLDAFEEYNKAVKSALFVTGNHDNWTNGHFEDRGFDIEADYRILTLNQKKFLLMHGDGVAKSGIHFPRKFSHRILRNKAFVKLFQFVQSPEQGLKVMKWFSSQTRKKDIEDPVPLNKIAKNLFKKMDLDYILCGHDHIPRVETFPSGTFLNTGAFFKHNSVVVYNNESCSLVKWQSDSKKFLPFEKEENNK